MACMAEKGVEYEQVYIEFSTGEHKKPPHIFRNPFGQVPALEDGDLMLFESRAISRYIAYKYKDMGTDLLRKNNLEEMVMVDVWMEVESTQFNPAIAPIVFQCIFAPFFGMVPDEKVIALNVENLGKVLDVYEARLSKTKYLAGDFFSLADLNHLPTVHYLMATPHASLIESRPNVKAWWKNVSTRPACKKVTAPMSFSKKG